MSQENTSLRVAGTWLALASLLMAAVLVTHGPLAPDLGEQMRRVASEPIRWIAVHWVAAGALSLYAVTALVVLTAGSRLTRGWWTTTAWAVVAVGALWTMTTAVAEATVVADAAAAGATETFEAWWAFAEGKASGFSFVALAVAVIAANEARAPDGAVPSWAAWIGALAGLGSFGGWALAMWFDVGPASLAWVACSVVMSAWTFWFGVAVSRSRRAGSGSRVAAPGTRAPATAGQGGRT